MRSGIELMYEIFKLVSFLLAAILFTSILQGCSESDYGTNNNSNGTPGTNEVFARGMAFTPTSKTISVGTTITWTNKESVNHTITSGTPGTPSGLFDSGNIGLNGTFSFTFTQAGTFNYYCKLHTSMSGTIIVQ